MTDSGELDERAGKHRQDIQRGLSMAGEEGIKATEQQQFE